MPYQTYKFHFPQLLGICWKKPLCLWILNFTAITWQLSVVLHLRFAARKKLKKSLGHNWRGTIKNRCCTVEIERKVSPFPNVSSPWNLDWPSRTGKKTLLSLLQKSFFSFWWRLRDELPAGEKVSDFGYFLRFFWKKIVNSFFLLSSALYLSHHRFSSFDG